MNFPDTPKTIIAQLVDPNKVEIWNGAWRRFFDIYHATIKIMISNSFAKRNWNEIPSYVIDEVVADVIVSLNKIFTKNVYDSKRAKFRFFLKTICDRRTVDYIREHSNDLNTDSLDNEDSNIQVFVEKLYSESMKSELAEEEIRAFKESIILDTYMSIRHNFDAQTCTAFEMIKLEDANMDDVVKELGVSSNVINNAVYRITKKLKEAISQDKNLEDIYHA